MPDKQTNQSYPEQRDMSIVPPAKNTHMSFMFVESYQNLCSDEQVSAIITSKTAPAIRAGFTMMGLNLVLLEDTDSNSMRRVAHSLVLAFVAGVGCSIKIRKSAVRIQQSKMVSSARGESQGPSWGSTASNR